MVESERSTIWRRLHPRWGHSDVQRHVWADPCNLLRQVTKVAKSHGKSHWIHDCGPVMLGNMKQATWRRGDSPGLVSNRMVHHQTSPFHLYSDINFGGVSPPEVFSFTPQTLEKGQKSDMSDHNPSAVNICGPPAMQIRLHKSPAFGFRFRSRSLAVWVFESPLRSQRFHSGSDMKWIPFGSEAAAGPDF